MLNVLSGNLDGSMLYVVAWLGQGRGSVYEGWIHGSAARMLSKAERRRVPKELRLPINEVMKRSTFVEVTQNWSNMHPDALALRTEEIVQVSLVGDRNKRLHGGSRMGGPGMAEAHKQSP